MTAMKCLLPTCNNTVIQPNKGRTKKYCSRACQRGSALKQGKPVRKVEQKKVSDALRAWK